MGATSGMCHHFLWHAASHSPTPQCLHQPLLFQPVLLRLAGQASRALQDEHWPLIPSFFPQSAHQPAPREGCHPHIQVSADCSCSHGRRGLSPRLVAPAALCLPWPQAVLLVLPVMLRRGSPSIGMSSQKSPYRQQVLLPGKSGWDCSLEKADGPPPFQGISPWRSP